jgi:hypothetical protein
MRLFEIKVPYRETVSGTMTYHVEAETEQDAKDALREDEYLYYYEETDYSENYVQLFFDDLSLVELSERSAR